MWLVNPIGKSVRQGDGGRILFGQGLKGERGGGDRDVEYSD